MQIDVIERYVDQVLEINGFCKGDKELLRQLLHRLYTAATMFHLMTEEQRKSRAGKKREKYIYCGTPRIFSSGMSEICG